MGFCCQYNDFCFAILHTREPTQPHFLTAKTMGTVLRIYERLLQKYPLITSSVQTGILMATGDVIAQTTIEGTSLKDINFVRTSQFGTVGLFVAVSIK